MINGSLYFSAPDHVWALGARTGRELWHYAYLLDGRQLIVVCAGDTLYAFALQQSRNQVRFNARLRVCTKTS